MAGNLASVSAGAQVTASALWPIFRDSNSLRRAGTALHGAALYASARGARDDDIWLTYLSETAAHIADSKEAKP